MSPNELSRALREGEGDDLNARRKIVALSLLGILAGQIVSLYQFGIIKRLPDPPLAVFDSTKVNAGEYAYKRLQVPDAFLMLATYATTAILAGMGQPKRAEKSPILPLLMGGKILLDVVTNLVLATEEWKGSKKLCFYCQCASVISIASLFLAWPEVRAAWKKVRR